MADPTSDYMNRQIREAAAGYPADDHQAINRALRQAAGRPAPEPPPSRSDDTPKLPPLGGTDYLLASEEPLASESDEWERFIFRRRVVALLDQYGRLPGEAGYDRQQTGPADPAAYDLDIAVRNRRRRWQARGL